VSTIAKGNSSVNISGHSITVVNMHVSVTHWNKSERFRVDEQLDAAAANKRENNRHGM
jgi:hypothetical protein